MEMWLGLPYFPAERLRELAAAAEELGIAGVALSEHVCVPATVDSPFPGAPAGTKVQIPIETQFPDPLTTIAALGAETTRLRFTTGILLMPLRHPILLAKEVSTAAALTGGRLDLGVGVGWMREEFDALGIPFERRGNRMDEMLPLVRQLWTGELVEHHGDHFSFGPIAIRPVPPQPVRLLIGGMSDAAVRRAATLGDGWIGMNSSVEDIEAVVKKLDIARQDAGTGSRPFELRAVPRGSITKERIRAMTELGVSSVIVLPQQIVAKGTPSYEISVDAVVDGLPAMVDLITTA